MHRTLEPDESAPWRSQNWIDQEQYPCEYCGAEPGKRCRRPNGQNSAFPHASRFYQFKDAAVSTATCENRRD